MADRDAAATLAAEHRALEVRERAEAQRWAAAAADPEFRREMREIARDLRWAESHPE